MIEGMTHFFSAVSYCVQPLPHCTKPIGSRFTTCHKPKRSEQPKHATHAVHIINNFLLLYPMHDCLA